MDHQKIHLEEHKGLEENKETEFVYLLEEERLTEAPRAEVQPEAGARRLEDIETCDVDSDMDSADEQGSHTLFCGGFR